MMDLPETYRNAMPIETDETKLLDAEQAIRQNYRKDMRVHGPYSVGYRSVAGEPPLNGPMNMSVHAQMGRAQAAADQAAANKSAPPAPVDFSKMSTAEKILLGMQQNAAERAGGSTSAAPAVTTQTRLARPGGMVTSQLSASDKMMLGLSQSRPARTSVGRR